MDKLARYKLDKAFTEGVDLYLDEAPDVVFRVRLPSRYNRAYTNAIYGGMGLKLSSDGLVKTDSSIMDARFAQEDAFVAHCILSMDGEALPENFATDYPEALAELMEKATELANEIEAKVADTVKKSPALSSGSENGAASKSSTTKLKGAVG
jgi:hypothetical protein